MMYDLCKGVQKSAIVCEGGLSCVIVCDRV